MNDIKIYKTSIVTENGEKVNLIFVEGIFSPGACQKSVNEYFKMAVQKIAVIEFEDGYNVFYHSRGEDYHMAVIVQGFTNIPFDTYC